jgi:hypothetical protein
VSSATSTAAGTGSSPRPGQPAVPAPDGATRALSFAAAIGIGGSLLIMLVASAVKYSPAIPPPPWQSGPPLLELVGKLPVATTYAALWIAVVLGAAGVMAGLAALARGARFPARPLITAALIVTALFAVLPPSGSTDTLSYATFGRIEVTGHNPYVMTPNMLKRTGDPIGRLAPLIWKRHGSVYGPLATMEETGAAELGGTSGPQIVFWLKLWNAIVFAGVVIGLDRMVRSDPARRARAHLLWSLNPLVLWGIVASGHVQGMATAAAFFGLALLRIGRTQDGGSAEPGVLAAVAAGALVGVASDLLLYYVILGLALAWALRRSAAALFAGCASLGVVLVLPYLALGSPSIHALSSRGNKATAFNFYQLFSRPLRHELPANLELLVLLGCAVLALLLLVRLPDAVPDLPAVQPALAVGVAFLLLWFYALPWYDAMIIPFLALYVASRLDYLVLVQLAAASFAMMPGGTPYEPPLGWLRTFSHADWFVWTPVILLGCVAAVIVLALSGAWKAALPARRVEVKPA